MQPWQDAGLIVPICLMWCLWWERNSRCFEDNERSIPNLKLFFFRTLLDWLVAMLNQSFSSFLDFLDSSNFCTWIVDPLYTLCELRCSFFDINKNYYLSKKKNKKEKALGARVPTDHLSRTVWELMNFKSCAEK